MNQQINPDWIKPGAVVPVDAQTTAALVNALRLALAQPWQEPAAWMYPNALCDIACLSLCTKGFTQFPECAAAKATGGEV